MSLEQIFKTLKLTPEKGLYIIKEGRWKGILSKRLEYLIGSKLLTPDAFFCFDKKPLILFYDSPRDKKNLFKAVWNFNETPVVIINEADSIEIYNGFSYSKNESTLEKLADPDRLADFSYFELVTGKTLQRYHDKLKYESRVDYHLLKNIREARDILIEKYEIKDFLANALIGKCIFVRYLIDRNVEIKFDGKLKWTNNDFCRLLQNKQKVLSFFGYLRDKFHGESFLNSDSGLDSVSPDVFVVLKKLLEGTDFESGQPSLFAIYDFSIIPVEFISNVYEHFIGLENQAKKGAYYTPVFLVEYILSQTVEKYLEDNPNKYNCKVLDPSCGSGIFLVEALRRIIERYVSLNNVSSNTEEFKKALRQLAEDNIFGIDEDENAINVAIFSVYLALLDYLKDPKDIESFTFPKLKEKGNFHKNNFFNLKADFNNKFSKISFDFVIGNPPWKRGSSKEALFIKYVDKRRRKEKKINLEKDMPEIAISNNEIAQAFLLRTSDFSSEKTKCALIVTSKTLYNLNAKKFRSYFLHNYYVDKVLELAPVRREIFDKSNDPSIAPAAILFFAYSHSKSTESNELIHLCLKPNRLFSLFKIFVLQRPDIKKVVQKRLMDQDWLWKVLVYGSYLDFNFIRRLKEDYKTIGDVIYDENNYLVKQGLKRRDGNKKIDVNELIGWDFLDISKSKQIEPFFISSQLEKWKDRYVGYIHCKEGNIVKEVFTPPVLLLKETVNTYLRSIPAISLEKKILFTDKVTSIKAIGDSELLNYYKIAGLLYSSLFSYFILIKSSTVGIMIEQQVNDKEKFYFPFIDDSKIAKTVKQIENISKLLYEEETQKPLLNTKIPRLETKRQELVTQLDDEIFNSFDLDEQERSLVDYAVNVTIPLIMRHKGYEKKLFYPIPFRDKLLEEYINIFLSRFKKSFKEKHLKAEIWHARNIVGIFFKVAPNSSTDKQVIKWLEKENETLLNKMVRLGTEKITEDLFIQKDIRGFEKKGFYIIKPNEKKLWHKAIGYLDADEFMDAILKAGKETYHG